MYRTILLLILCFVLSMSPLLGQSLSDKGREFWEEGLALSGSAKTADDLFHASEAFIAVLITDPDYSSAYYELGKLLLRRRKFQDAEVVLNKYKELVPTETEKVNDLIYQTKIRYYQNPVVAKLAGRWVDDRLNPSFLVSINVLDDEIRVFFKGLKDDKTSFWLEGGITISGCYPESCEEDRIWCSPIGNISINEGWISHYDYRGFKTIDIHLSLMPPYDLEAARDLYYPYESRCHIGSSDNLATVEVLSTYISFVGDLPTQENAVTFIQDSLQDRISLNNFQYYRMRPVRKSIRDGRKYRYEYYWNTIGELTLPDAILVRDKLPTLRSIVH